MLPLVLNPLFSLTLFSPLGSIPFCIVCFVVLGEAGRVGHHSGSDLASWFQDGCSRGVGASGYEGCVLAASSER